jgi:hypothetical protein
MTKLEFVNLHAYCKEINFGIKKGRGNCTVQKKQQAITQQVATNKQK